MKTAYQSEAQKRINTFLSCILVALCLAGGTAWGQINLSLQQAIRQALSNNPRLTVAQGRIEDAQGQKTQAGLRLNPRLTLQTEDIRPSSTRLPFSFVNSTEDYVTVGQVIESSGKRGKRVDVAAFSVGTTELERDLTRRQIIGNVSTAYWLASNYSRAQILLEEALATYEEDVTYSRNRVQEGVLAESDLLRIQLERDRVRAQVITAKRDADQAIVNLYREMGKTEFPTTHLSDSLENVSKAAIPDPALVLQTRPEIQIARQAVTEAEANVRLQRAYGRPDPEVLIGYKRNVGYDTLYGALQIDLPISNRNQGNVASAAARLHTAQSSLQVTEANVKADLESATRAYKDEQLLTDQLPETLARAIEAERLTRAAYREGGVDLLRLLDAERNRIQVQIDYYRALADLRQSIVSLYLAGGGSMTEEGTP